MRAVFIERRWGAGGDVSITNGRCPVDLVDKATGIIWRFVCIETPNYLARYRCKSLYVFMHEIQVLDMYLPTDLAGQIG